MTRVRVMSVGPIEPHRVKFTGLVVFCLLVVLTPVFAKLQSRATSFNLEHHMANLPPIEQRALKLLLAMQEEEWQHHGVTNRVLGFIGDEDIDADFSLDSHLSEPVYLETTGKTTGSTTSSKPSGLQDNTPSPVRKIPPSLGAIGRQPAVRDLSGRCTGDAVRQDLSKKCKALIHMESFPEDSSFLQFLLPNTTADALFSCVAKHQCASDSAISFMKTSVATSKAILKFLSKTLVSAFCTKECNYGKQLVLAIFSKATGMSEADITLMKPLVTMLFDHRIDANPYCSDASLVGPATDKAIPLLMSRYSTKHPVDKTQEDLLKRFFQLSVPAMLTADCAKTSNASDTPVTLRKYSVPKGAAAKYISKTVEMLNTKAEKQSPEQIAMHNILSEAIDKYVEGNPISTSEGLTRGLFQPLLARLNDHADGTLPHIFHNLTAASGVTRCHCDNVMTELTMHLLEKLPDVGMQLGRLSIGSDNKLVSTDAEVTRLIGLAAPSEGPDQHAYVKMMSRVVAYVEAAIHDPAKGVRHLIRHGLEIKKFVDEHNSQDQELPASTMVKVVLVGLPVMQNVYTMLLKSEQNADLLAKKLKWFVVVNIIWAVWHQVEEQGSMTPDKLPLQHENVLRGYLVTALSINEDLNYSDGVLTSQLEQSDVDWFVGLYTVWNSDLFYTMFRDKICWQMVTEALGAPIASSLVRHGSVNQWLMYRANYLLHVIAAIMKVLM